MVGDSPVSTRSLAALLSKSRQQGRQLPDPKSWRPWQHWPALLYPIRFLSSPSTASSCRDQNGTTRPCGVFLFLALAPGGRVDSEA